LVLQYYNWLLRSFVPIITAVPTRYTFCTSFLNPLLYSILIFCVFIATIFSQILFLLPFSFIVAL